jgi:hypothetical protein
MINQYARVHKQQLFVSSMSVKLESKDTKLHFECAVKIVSMCRIYVLFAKGMRRPDRDVDVKGGHMGIIEST